MMNWNDDRVMWQVVLARHADLQREAANARDTHSERRTPRPHLYGSILVTLGVRLVSWGQRLQSHGTAMSIPDPVVAQHSA